MRTFVNELWLTKKKERKKERKKKDKMEIFVAEFLDGTKGWANFEGSFAIHK